MRNVLVVSYYYPPSGGPGVQRVLKFSRYLPRFGWRPVVLTVPETAAFPVRDPSLAAEIPPEAKVVRSPIREFYHLARSTAGGAGPINLSTTAGTARGFRERAVQGLRAAFFIPDGRMGWLSGGLRAGREVCRREKIDVLLASGPPFTAFWIARRLAEKTGLPLVLDFRDPWIGAPFYPPRPFWARRLDERLERTCVERAAAIVTVNRDIRDDLLARHRRIDPARIRIITNGYDPADFEGRARARPSLWTLGYTGTWPSRGLPPALSGALSRLLEQDPALASGMQLRLAGPFTTESVRSALPAALAPIVRVDGYLPHGDSVQLLLDSHLLLLFIEDSPRARGILTGKLFEYIGSGTPVLALAPEGEAAELIRETGAGRVVASGDAAAIQASLEEALAAFRASRRAFGPENPKAALAYARPALTERLAAILNAVGA